MNVKLVWVTPDAEEKVAYMARVSNPGNQDNKETAPKLLRYLMKNKHWSPFEMVNVCMEIECTRDIGRQIIRHRSFSFQEFSQRYAEALDMTSSEVRLQDTKNRQNSLPTEDRELQRWWDDMQLSLIAQARGVYGAALNNGIAKEVARKILPEGLTGSRMYMNGTLRSWMHYVDIRCDEATQKEHRDIADKCKAILATHFPSLYGETNGK
jgi:thymidylate synthase (FAD)|tara:strand:+ start:922 stop:1551 length:630 start_codon:yes stop_codon:yes gene_type:complete